MIKLKSILTEDSTDKLPGGLGDNKTVQDIADKHNVPIQQIQAELEKGVDVEMEHTDDATLANEIAMDHLMELPNYYTKLATIEPEHVEEGKLRNAIATGALAASSLLPLAAQKIDPHELYNQIAKHEGIERVVYKDSKGIPTVGIGFNLESNHNKQFLKQNPEILDKIKNKIPLSDRDIKILYNHSLKQAYKDAVSVIPNFKQLPKDVKMIIIDMSFNLGKTRLAGFKNMIKALNNNDFETAAKEMKDSAWYHQVGNRSKYLVNQMKQHAV